MYKQKYKIPFIGSENISKSYSQSGQDLFVLSCLAGKKEGTFLDLGCHHPEYINNTYLLETEFYWKGVSVDIDKKMTDLYTCRKTLAINADCVTLDFDKITKLIGSSHIDYLSLDLEPAKITLECLKNIPFNLIDFSLITYEHDSYRFGEIYKNLAFEIMKGNGYQLICEDVRIGANKFEDWYYNPKYVNYEYIKVFEKDNIEWDLIIYE